MAGSVSIIKPSVKRLSRKIWRTWSWPQGPCTRGTPEGGIVFHVPLEPGVHKPLVIIYHLITLNRGRSATVLCKTFFLQCSGCAHGIFYSWCQARAVLSISLPPGFAELFRCCISIGEGVLGTHSRQWQDTLGSTDPI